MKINISDTNKEDFNKKILKIFTHKRVIFIISLFFISILSFFFVIRPSIIGYTIYKDISDNNLSIDFYSSSIGDLKEQILIKDVNLSSCYGFNNELIMLAEKNSDKSFKLYDSLLKCNSDLKVKENEINNYLSLIVEDKNKCDSDKNSLKFSYENMLNDLKKEFSISNDILKDDSRKLKQDFDNLAFNSANNICCKAKVDNNLINSYIVQNNRIICNVDSELKINC
jgi:hypothetical protein